MPMLVAGLVLFVGVHSASIVGLRDRAVARWGEGAWKGVYALVALAGLVAIVLGYGDARLSPQVVFAPPVWTRHLALLVMVPVFPLVMAAYLPGRIQRAVGHPMLAGTVLWGIAHLLANGMLHDVVLFGGIGAWAVVDWMSLRTRVQRPTMGAPPASYNDVLAVVLGLALYGGFLWGLHQWLFGVAPLS